MISSGPGLFLVGRLLIAASTSALVIGLFRLQFLPGLVLVGSSVYEFIHFFQVYWFMCIELFAVISDGRLYFCRIGGDIPFIIFLLHLFDYSLFSFF